MSGTPTPISSSSRPNLRWRWRAAGVGWLFLLFAALLAAGCRTAPAPGQETTGAAPVTAAPADPAAATAQLHAEDQPTLAPSPIPTGVSAVQPASAPAAASPLLPGIVLQLQVDFQEALPDGAPLFQVQSWPALETETARQIAGELGVSGGIYQPPSFPPGEPGVMVAGETGSLEARSAGQWLYLAAPGAANPLPGLEVATPEQTAGLILTLERLGLLSYPYQPQAAQPGQAQIAQLAASAPLIFESGTPAGVDALFAADGSTGQIDYRPLLLEETGTFPIISAREAWERLTAAQPQGVILLESWPEPSHTWQRPHPAGERAELFGRLQVLQPLEPSAAPLVLLQGYPLSGELAPLLQANQGQLWQVWGQMETGEAGGQRLNVEGWQVAAFPETSLTGRVEGQGDELFLQTGRQQVLLPDAPQELTQGQVVTAGGVLIEGGASGETAPRIEWWTLTSEAPGARRGPGFQPLVVHGQAAAAEPAPPPPAVQPGERVEGETALLNAIVHQYADGQRQELTLTLEASEQRPESLLANVEAPAPPGLAAFHRLPLRVWGEFVAVDGSLPTLRVERVEPLYPGLTTQAWLGLLETVELEGGARLRFTAQDGQAYVLGATPITGDLGPLPGAAGEAVIIEGFVPPDQSYAGLPVLNALLIAPAQGRADLEGYEMAPPVVQEPGSAVPPDTAVIERIDLVYVAPDLRYAPGGASAAPAFAQPAWRFSGVYNNGIRFTLLVQALRRT